MDMNQTFDEVIQKAGLSSDVLPPDVIEKMRLAFHYGVVQAGCHPDPVRVSLESLRWLTQQRLVLRSLISSIDNTGPVM